MVAMYTADVTPIFESGSNYLDGVDRGRIEVTLPCSRWKDADELRLKLRARLRETTRYDVDGHLHCTLHGTITTTRAWIRFLAAAGRAGIEIHYRTDDLDAVIGVMKATRRVPATQTPEGMK